MDERYCTVGDIKLCYESFGDEGDPTVLLVMGLGMQMVGWRRGFLPPARRARLSRRSLRQPRQRPLDAAARSPTPTSRQLLRRAASAPATRLPTWPPTPSAFSTHLGVERAHVVGVSMGGMIAQTIARAIPSACCR